MGVESYKHKYAKTVLASWLRGACEQEKNEYVHIDPLWWRINRGGPHFGVWLEYPICADGDGLDQVWDEIGIYDTDRELAVSPYENAPPTYEQLCAAGKPPIAIFDLAIQHKGRICYGVEVVHANPISDKKIRILNDLNRGGSFEIWTISAEWIMRQIARPKRLVMDRVL